MPSSSTSQSDLHATSPSVAPPSSSGHVPFQSKKFNATTFDISAAPSIHAIATARIYHAPLPASGSAPNGDEWVYSRLKGSLKFGRNWIGGSTTRTSTSNSGSNPVIPNEFWFTLADEKTGKTIWMFQIPESGFTYEVDRPFFHIFNGRTRKYGFLFEDDDDAALFHKKVMSEVSREGTSLTRVHPFLSLLTRAPAAPGSKRGRGSLRSRNSFAKSSRTSLRSKSVAPPRTVTSTTRGLAGASGNAKSLNQSSPPSSFSFPSGLKTSMISPPAPNSFRHIAHVGVNERGVFEVSKDIDEVFKERLVSLVQGGGLGGRRSLDGQTTGKVVIYERGEFADSFWKDVERGVASHIPVGEAAAISAH